MNGTICTDISHDISMGEGAWHCSTCDCLYQAPVTVEHLAAAYQPKDGVIVVIASQSRLGSLFGIWAGPRSVVERDIEQEGVLVLADSADVAAMLMLGTPSSAADSLTDQAPYLYQ